MRPNSANVIGKQPEITSMKTLAATMLVLAGLYSTAYAADAPAGQGAYVGGVYSFIDYKESGIPAVKPKAIALMVGWQFNQNLAVEGRIGAGAGSDDLDGIDIKVDSYYSGLLRGTVPMTDSFNLYAIAGVTSGKLKASAAGVTVSDSETKASYGIGVEFVVQKQSGISVEWGRFLSGDGYTADAISLGYRYHF